MMHIYLGSYSTFMTPIYIRIWMTVMFEVLIRNLFALLTIMCGTKEQSDSDMIPFRDIED